ncbi:hypothetical protein BU202_02930 [Streptococcus cuniculi]|uniref:Uncharacterized protein n=1 Tax=Streptococcus cuniculi TaxID=1432788 RepID=A0A1Q8E9X3_9STRE|nr:hypothetical protein [Streptococcus cuniculi]OLF48588.1 hypothetical protein BU202_02930 [Streptococcus cuniculi]
MSDGLFHFLIFVRIFALCWILYRLYQLRNTRSRKLILLALFLFGISLVYALVDLIFSILQ